MHPQFIENFLAILRAWLRLPDLEDLNMRKQHKQLIHHIMINNSILYGRFKISNYKLPFMRSRTSHLNACTSTKDVHPSSEHTIFKMSFARRVKFKPMCILFPMGKANNPPSKRLSWKSTSNIYLLWKVLLGLFVCRFVLSLKFENTSKKKIKKLDWFSLRKGFE